MRHRRIRFTITALCTLAFVFALAAPALAIPDIYTPQWGISGSGMTHRNAMAKAMQIAGARGAGWVDSIAIDRAVYPDVVFKDNIDHNYNHFGGARSYYNSSWGSDFGNPQGKVQMYYNAAVANLRAGDRIGASKNIGYLSHYLIDINGPLHTQESATENNALHTDLEADASGASYGSYIHDDGYQYYGGHSSPSSLTVANATSAHAYYSDLVSTYHSHGFNSHVHDIEGVNFNRGVNSIADLIQSVQNDADSVTAVIDSVSPSSSTSDQPVAFAGHGADSLHSMAEWRWRSSINGALATVPAFTTSALKVGIHNIYFIVRCNGPKWSAETFTPYVVGAVGTKPLPVYRFLNRKTNVHFYTASEAERRTVQTTLASTYALEGVAYALDTSATANSSPLYRFFDKKRGVHFYTASETEKNTVLNTLGDIYQYDGVVTYISLTPEAGTQPVYRFYNFKKGVHFYTASLAERNMVVAKLGETFRYEGIAYHFQPPWAVGTP